MTKPGDAHEAEIAALRGVLETFGADLGRWPQPARLRFAGLLSSDGEARQLLAEAKALDAMLAEADPGAADVPPDLADRIMAKAAAEPPSRRRGAPREGTVVPFARRPSSRSQTSWQIAGLMAASLLVGVLTGAAGGFSGVLDSLGSAAAYAAGEDDDETEIALQGFSGDTNGEDVW